MDCARMRFPDSASPAAKNVMGTTRNAVRAGSEHRFDPRKHHEDREFMREFTREAAADTTGNPVYKAIAEYDRKRYKDLLD